MTTEAPALLIWLILLAPLFAAAAITLFCLRQPVVSARLSIIAILISFAASCVVYFWTGGSPVRVPFEWLNVGDLKVNLGLQIDRLSLVMLLVVSGVGSAIHIYSYAYMSGDPSFSRFFASLSLFSFSMLGIVLADNFFMMFIFWELVGVSSYLLIGFWHERDAAAEACKKAFITNRLGDFGFILGIILIWSALGTVEFGALKERLAQHPNALGAFSTIAGLLIFCGAVGKSAQFPLHVWLPDAMEGPTPVSALIHAATMVAAGVYMLCRVFFLFELPAQWPEALAFMEGISALKIISWIGGITALLAALIAVQQNDIKRILAYSTLSQLGYMVMAVGLAAPGAAMYHLTTHAFFKALLFLGAGSVIYALHHEQDIWKMGALRERMPITFWTFLIGALALAGVPPLSGFFSKDEILAAAAHGNVFLFILAALVAVLTTFYMARLFMIAFLGPAKSEAPAHAEESPFVMTGPLLVLATLSVLAGLWGINHYLGAHFAAGVQHAGTAHHAETHGGLAEALFEGFNHSPVAAITGLAAFIFGLALAFGLYWNKTADPLPSMAAGLSRAMRDRFYFDELYTGIIALTHEAVAKFADWFDRWIVAGLLVRGTHGTVEIFGRALRLIQTGNLQTYTFLLVAGAALLLLLAMKQRF